MSNNMQSVVFGGETDGEIVDLRILYSRAASPFDAIERGSWVLRDLGYGSFLVLNRSVDCDDVAIAFWDLSVQQYAEGAAPENDEASTDVSYVGKDMLISFMTEAMPWRRWAWTPSMAQEALDSGNWKAIEAWLRTDMGLMVAYDNQPQE